MKSFSHDITHDGVLLRLSDSKRSLLSTNNIPLKVCDWSSSGDTELLRGLAALGGILADQDANSEQVLLAHAQAAAMSDSDARALGLPVSVPYQLRVWSEGNWTDDTYDLRSEFLDSGKPVYIDRRSGAFIFVGRLVYRIPDPLFTIIEEVSAFPVDRDGKIESQARISEILGDSKLGAAKLNPEEQVANIRIRHAAGFSAAITGSLDDPELTPILFSKQSVESISETGEILDETQQILDPTQANSFVNEFFKAGQVRPTYVLGSGEYVFIDPSVRPAFRAFREISAADKETRKAFIKAPNAVLASRIPPNVEQPEILVNHAFVETAQFSDRVLGINKWEAPDLPWLADEANEWGTDLIVFEQPGNASPVVIPKQVLNDAVEALEEGVEAGMSSVNVAGVEIPVSSQLLAAMQQMLPTSPDPEPGPEPGPEPEPEPKPDGPFVVETIDGFEAVNYVKALHPPDYQMHFAPPRALVPSTSLMKHQEAGLKWLISAFNTGLPGVLIADDMGLGKTLQALVFMALYQEQVPEFKRRPCLIVAPTGLLNNWLREINQHLGDFGLGEVTKAYGSRLKDLKADVSGRDTDFGVPMLNTQRLSNSNVVLTTYESLRDYQISFAQVSFGVVVFDEIQKTKNPRSLLSRAAAAVNGIFQIGLSGTPVENSLADLWTILDVLAPGLIRMSLKDFMGTYAGPTDNQETIEKLKKLQEELLEPSEERVHPVLRRLKSQVFDDGDMPKKIIHPALSTSMVMPPEQAEAYNAQLEAVQRGQIKTIQALQAFKRISLTPRPFDHWLDDPIGFISASGRLAEFFKILDAIKIRDEKALIFVESRELQPVLAQVLKERYRLIKLPLVINGSVSGDSRQNSVNEFQKEAAGFNVMLISPKAGGVGLTLTAANNVVHLERWWNPAVEDQCNDRAYRIGQKRDVNVYTPVARYPVSEVPSFDLVLDGILSKKRGLAESLFVPSELSPEDFAEMFGGLSSVGQGRAFSPITILESYDIETGEGFEDYVADALYDCGFSVSKTKKSWDGGCDLIAKSGESIILCQVKQVRSDKSLMQGVDEIIKAKSRYESQKPTHLALVTNAKNVAPMQARLAHSNDVILLLADSIARYGEALRNKISY